MSSFRANAHSIYWRRQKNINGSKKRVDDVFYNKDEQYNAHKTLYSSADVGVVCGWKNGIIPWKRFGTLPRSFRLAKNNLGFCFKWLERIFSVEEAANFGTRKKPYGGILRKEFFTRRACLRNFRLEVFWILNKRLAPTQSRKWPWRRPSRFDLFKLMQHFSTVMFSI